MSFAILSCFLILADANQAPNIRIETRSFLLKGGNLNLSGDRTSLKNTDPKAPKITVIRGVDANQFKGGNGLQETSISTAFMANNQGYKMYQIFSNGSEKSDLWRIDFKPQLKGDGKLDLDVTFSQRDFTGPKPPGLPEEMDKLAERWKYSARANLKWEESIVWVFQQGSLTRVFVTKPAKFISVEDEPPAKPPYDINLPIIDVYTRYYTLTQGALKVDEAKTTEVSTTGPKGPVVITLTGFDLNKLEQIRDLNRVSVAGSRTNSGKEGKEEIYMTWRADQTDFWRATYVPTLRKDGQIDLDFTLAEKYTRETITPKTDRDKVPENWRYTTKTTLKEGDYIAWVFVKDGVTRICVLTTKQFQP